MCRYESDYMPMKNLTNIMLQHDGQTLPKNPEMSFSFLVLLINMVDDNISLIPFVEHQQIVKIIMLSRMRIQYYNTTILHLKQTIM